MIIALAVAVVVVWLVVAYMQGAATGTILRGGKPTLCRVCGTINQPGRNACAFCGRSYQDTGSHP